MEMADLQGTTRTFYRILWQHEARAYVMMAPVLPKWRTFITSERRAHKAASLEGRCGGFSL